MNEIKTKNNLHIEGFFDEQTSTISYVVHDNIEKKCAVIDSVLDFDYSSGDIDYVNAHATGTPRGDEIELNTLKDYLKKDTVISALKGHIGHAMGACSLAEMTYTIMMMNKGIALHTAHLTDPCDDYFNLITEPKEMEIKYALKNSFGFGGRSSVALLSKAD